MTIIGRMPIDMECHRNSLYRNRLYCNRLSRMPIDMELETVAVTLHVDRHAVQTVAVTLHVDRHTADDGHAADDT